MVAVSPAPSLLSPCKLGGGLIEVKNRVCLAPLTRARCPGNKPNDTVRTYYEQRSGGGLLITEATHVSPMSVGFGNTPGIWSEEQVAAWKSVVDGVHKQKSTIFLQAWHMGRATHSSFLPNAAKPISCSATAIKSETYTATGQKVPYETAREMTVEDIKKTVQEYKLAARNAKNAGFDGVEIHTANGYLVDQFFQRCTNLRSDAYGGPVENRFRFFREVLEAVLEELPAGRVACRLSPNGSFNDMGTEHNLEDFTYAATELNKYKLAYLHVIDGLSFGFHDKTRAMTLADVRKVYDGPIMANCGYTRDIAEGAIRSGAADLVAFGRIYMSNPDLAERFAADLPIEPPADMSTWYTPDPNNAGKGYIDWPTAAAAAAK